MNLPRVASLALLLLAGSAFQSLQAAASNTSGNPFGNGTYFPTDGTFQAVFRGMNLTGVTTFNTLASSTTTTLGGGGLFTVTYQGTTYLGNCNASYASITQVAGVLYASVTRQGTGTIANSLNAPNTTLANSGTVSVSSSNAILVSTTNGVSNSQAFSAPPATNTLEINTLTSGSTASLAGNGNNVDQSTVNGLATGATAYNDVLQASGSFLAKLSPSYPNQSLNGKGSLTFSRLDFSTNVPTIVSSTADFSVTGVRSSNTTTAMTAVTTSEIYVNSTYSTQ